MEDAGSRYHNQQHAYCVIQISLREKQRLAKLDMGWLGQNPGLQFPCSPPVTESELILLATRQANKSRDELVGQGIMTLFGRQADQEDDELVS